MSVPNRGSFSSSFGTFSVSTVLGIQFPGLNKFGVSGFFWLVKLVRSRVKGYLCTMEHTRLLRAILPDVLIDNFDVANFEKTDLRFDIWLDEKKVQMREDKKNSSVISHGFGEYRTIQDFPIRGRATYLHVRKRKWLDKDTGEIFSYGWELSEYDETHLNAEFVAFLKEGD